MAHLGKRVRFLHLVIALVLGMVGALGFLTLAGHARPAQAQVADPSKAAVILNWYAARNQGDNNAAAALFADDAFFVGAALRGFCSTQTPCYDRASEQQNLQQVAATTPNQCFTVTSLQVSGSIVTGRAEARNDITRGNGIERTLVAFMAEVRDGKMVSFFQRLDLADPQTALNGAINAGTAPKGTPIPTPNPVCG